MTGILHIARNINIYILNPISLLIFLFQNKNSFNRGSGVSPYSPDYSLGYDKNFPYDSSRDTKMGIYHC
uniref:Uncharacterized protein n=1 Tax=Lepeophtheirus salmonis TaxID=72036 RepID=A0A0K2V717_LEPSM